MWAEVVIAIAIAAALASAVTAALHAILYKRDVRAAIGWAGFIFVAPYIGPLLYLLFGVNRIRRNATAIRPEAARAGQAPVLSSALVDEHLTNQLLLGDRVCENRLLSGNQVEILDSGARAFGVILARIADAKRSVAISTYIFEYDNLGRRVADALAAAAARGVNVRVLLDAVGSRERGREVAAALAGSGVRTALFLPPLTPWGILSVNLRKPQEADHRRRRGGVRGRNEHLR